MATGIASTNDQAPTAGSYSAISGVVESAPKSEAADADEDEDADETGPGVLLELDFDAEPSPTRASEPESVPAPAPATDDDQQFFHPSAASTEPPQAPPNSDVTPASKYVGRDSQSRLRLFHQEDRSQTVAATQAQRFLATMEIENTQLSTLSPTQENSSSAYDRFDIERSVPPLSSDHSQAANEGNAFHTQSSWKQQYSTRTESTVHTYKENDTGHIDLVIDPEPEAPYEEPESQDASYAVQTAGSFVGHGHGHPEPPETPAPPVNPFSHKGSVLKGHEMFGATQPSVGRAAETPTSARPSPNIYDDFTSPARNRLLSSPLAQRNTNHEEQTPLQSSTRITLSQSMTAMPKLLTVSKLARTLQRTNSLPEPRKYDSRKESQERRKREAEATLDSGSETESDIEADPTDKRLRRERDIQKSISGVTLSRPRSSSAIMEADAPQASRRRSIEEDYVAQCAGFDARDTQQDSSAGNTQSYDGPRDAQDDIVIPNSQRAEEGVVEPVVALLRHAPPKPHTPTDNLPSIADSPHDSERVPATETESAEQDKAVDSSKDEPGQSLPLQEMSSNRMDLRTPAASKVETRAEGPDEIILESSPSHNHVRPMGDIGLSFDGDNEEDNDLLTNPPGFTQDEGFLDAIKDPPLDLPSPPGPPESSDLSSIEDPEALLTTIETPDLAPDFAAQPTNGEHNLGKEQVSPPSIENESIASQPNQDHSEEVKAQDEIAGRSVSRAITPTIPEKETQDELQKEITELTSEKDTTLQKPKSTPDHSSTKLQLPVAKRLRTKSELKGPSQSLRRSADSIQKLEEDTATPHRSGRASRLYTGKRSIISEPLKNSTSARSAKLSSSVSKDPIATPQSTPRPADIDSVSVASSTRSSRRAAAIQITPNQQSPIFAAPKRNSKRKSDAISLDGGEQVIAPSRASKRQSTSRALRDDSEDPIALTSKVATMKGAQYLGLFGGMAFAVSYVKHEQEKDAVIKAISDNGGQILTDGFDGLFEMRGSSADEVQLLPNSAAKSTGFVALIADDHSRKTKYMQALALGLPCLSGRWISTSVAKGLLVDWTPYLLCAGSSTYLNNAHLSQKVEPYLATEAALVSTFAARRKLLEGKSILLVMGKGRADDKRKTFMFLTRVLGPDRLGQAVDYPDARKKLVEAEAEGRDWDILYVDSKEQAAQTAVFAPSTSTGKSRKRKRAPTVAEDNCMPPPKKIRVITDEIVVQSLIFGQLIDE